MQISNQNLEQKLNKIHSFGCKLQKNAKYENNCCRLHLVRCVFKHGWVMIRTWSVLITVCCDQKKWCWWVDNVFEKQNTWRVCLCYSIHGIYTLFKNATRCLTHFMSLISFDTPWKYQKTSGFQGYQKRSVACNGLMKKTKYFINTILYREW